MNSLIKIASKEPPVVELDSEACCAYVRFSGAPVEKTLELESAHCTVTADLAADGSVVGIELVGVREFTLQNLMAGLGIKLTRKQLGQARYVSAKAALAEAC